MERFWYRQSVHNAKPFGVLFVVGDPTSVAAQVADLDAARCDHAFASPADAPSLVTGCARPFRVVVADATLDEAAREALITAAFDFEHEPLLLFRIGQQPAGLGWNLPHPWFAADLHERVAGERLFDDFTNLHDVFLNASVVRRAMENTDVGGPPDMGLPPEVRDRFRLERVWVALLAVLKEAWEAPRNGRVRQWLGSLVDTSRLMQLLAQENARPRQQRIVEVRNYVAHRDKRPLWDAGRMGAIGQLESNQALHKEFSRVLLVGLRSAKTLVPWRAHEGKAPP